MDQPLSSSVSLLQKQGGIISLRILGKLVDKADYSDEDIDNMSWTERCRLIRSDPATCARHFDRAVQLLLKFLKDDVSPLGPLEDYFYRVEFQQRGSPHIHCLLWIKDSPKFEISKTEDIEIFVDTYIQCYKPPVELDPELSALVANQLHRHSHTCRKGRKFQCRFGYPKPPMPETLLLEPMKEDEVDKDKHKKNYAVIQQHLKSMGMGEDINMELFLARMKMCLEVYIMAIRSSLSNETIFLRRNPNEIRVNAYNPDVIKAWRANMDIQFVTNVYACAMYIASYVTKSQRGMSELLRNASEEAVANDGNNIRQQQGQTAVYSSREQPQTAAHKTAAENKSRE